MSLIEVNNLKFRYNSQDRAVNDISFKIEKGEFVCVLGHNGSGKSTLAKLLVGLLKASSGTILIDGIEMNEDTIDSIRKRIGIVFQNPDNQFVGVTVKDDIAFGLENRQIPRKDMLELIDYYSKVVKMNEFLDRNPEELSGGEKQRVALAGVLACDPDIIIFDEATSMLDPKGVNEVIDVIKDLKNKRTIISITHNLKETLMCDRILVMNEGKIVLNGTPKEVFRERKILKEAKLDILESMKLLDKLELTNIKNKKQIEDLLWEYTYQK